MHESTEIEDDYSDLGHDIDDFKAKTKIAIKFQLIFHKFKISKKINTIKAYSF